MVSIAKGGETKIRNMKGFIVEARAIKIIVLSSILNNWLKLLIPLLINILKYSLRIVGF